MKSYIKMVWAYLKAKLRQKCENDFGLMLRRVPDFFVNEIPVTFVRQVERHRRMGLEGQLLDLAMKRYTLHRRIPTS